MKLGVDVPVYRHGSTREIRKFAFLPKRLDGKLIWLRSYYKIQDRLIKRDLIDPSKFRSSKPADCRLNRNGRLKLGWKTRYVTCRSSN